MAIKHGILGVGVIARAQRLPVVADANALSEGEK
jgi:hypothetical protein